MNQFYQKLKVNILEVEKSVQELGMYADNYHYLPHVDISEETFLALSDIREFSGIFEIICNCFKFDEIPVAMGLVIRHRESIKNMCKALEGFDVHVEEANLIEKIKKQGESLQGILSSDELMPVIQ